MLSTDLSVRRPALGQQNVTSATLTGSIHDADGAVVNGANVTAKTPDQSANHSYQRQRTLSLPYLRIGVYDVTIEAAGFATLSRQLTLTVGQSLDLPCAWKLQDCRSTSISAPRLAD